MTRDELIEALAAIEHERWADWQRYVQRECAISHEYHDRKRGTRTGLILHPEDWQRWERQIATPYAQLSESEKQADRDQVMRYWPLIVEFVAQWIADNTTPDGRCYGELNHEQWSMEMSSR